MYPIILFGIGFSAAILRIAIKKSKTKPERLEIFLLYLIFTCIGLQGLIAFWGHAFMADIIAKQIGWPTGSPFQFEMAIANLSYGVLGILCIWLRGKFWIAVTAGNMILLLGAAYGHIVQMYKGNNALYNSGMFLYMGDIVIPILIFLLMIFYFRAVKEAQL